MSTFVDVEEIRTTRSEKLLAVLLTLFLLVGGLWLYVRTDEYVRKAVSEATLAPGDRAAIERLQAARRELARAQQARAAAIEDLELQREAYRTALEARGAGPARVPPPPAPAGPAAPPPPSPAPRAGSRPLTGSVIQLEAEYRAAAARFSVVDRRMRDASRAVRAAAPAARAAQERVARASEDRRQTEELLVFLARLAFIVCALLLAYWLLARLRDRNSRYLPVAFAGVAAAAILAFVLAGDYTTDYVDPIDVGPLLLSLFGVALTLAAFAGVQRYVARRMPARRVRRRECPFCGYPVGANERCEGCGREVVGSCARCGGQRRVGTLHCGVCGQA